MILLRFSSIFCFLCCVFNNSSPFSRIIFSASWILVVFICFFNLFSDIRVPLLASSYISSNAIALLWSVISPCLNFNALSGSTNISTHYPETVNLIVVNFDVTFFL